MSPRTRHHTRVTLLIALSLLTTGLAVVAMGSGLAAADATASSPAYREPYQEGPRNLTLAGNLTHADTGEPLPGVRLDIENRWTVHGDGEAYERGFDRIVSTSDTDGRWQANVSQGHVRLVIDDPAYLPTTASFSIDAGLQLDVPLRPANETLAQIDGQVTGRDGQPVAGATVSVQPDRTDRCSGDVCHAERHSRAGGDGERVVHVDDKTIVIRYEPRDDRWVHTQTDEDGRYSVRVPEGSYVVEAHARDHLEARHQLDLGARESATVDLSLTPIPPDSVTVTGVATDAETGEPIPYADVNIRNDRWGAWNHTRADEDGRFEIGTKPGHAIVTVRAGQTYWLPCETEDETARAEGSTTGSSDEGQAEPARAEPVAPPCNGHQERPHGYLPRVATHTAEAGDTVEVDATLERAPEPDATFSGWVVNASSQEGVPNATVTFRNEITNEWGRAVTDANGSFTIDVRAGYYTIRVDAPTHLSTAENAWIESGGDERLTLEVPPGEPRHRCCIAYGVAEASGSSTDVAHEPGVQRDTGEDAAGASTAPSDPSEGREAFEGSGGGLGSYQASTHSDGPEDDVQSTPLASVLATLALVGLGAVALAVWEPKRR